MLSSLPGNQETNFSTDMTRGTRNAASTSSTSADDKREARRGMEQGNLTNAFENYYPPALPWNMEDSISQKISKIYGMELFSDAEIFAGQHLTRIPVNRVIVGGASKKLKEMFDQNPTSVTAQDVDIQSFQVLLKHIYGDFSIPILSIVESIELAHRFGVRDSLDHCMMILQGGTIGGVSALRLLETALGLNNKIMIQSSLAYVAKYAWVFIETNEFLITPITVVETIVKEDSLELMDELQLFKAVMRWGSAKVSMKTYNTMTHEEIVRPLIKHIRFPCMSVIDFIEHVVPTPILSVLDKAQVMFTLQKIKTKNYRNPSGPCRWNASRFPCHSRRYFRPDCPLEVDSETMGISSSLCNYGVPKTPDATLGTESSTSIISFNFMEPLEGKFYFRVERISELSVGTSVYSPLMNIGLSPWQIIMKKHSQFDIGEALEPSYDRQLKDFLEVRLSCLHPTDTQLEWAFPVDGIFKLRPQQATRSSKNYYKHMRHVFRPLSLEAGFKRFLSFKELLNPIHGFVANDAILFEADVTVGESNLK